MKSLNLLSSFVLSASLLATTVYAEDGDSASAKVKRIANGFYLSGGGFLGDVSGVEKRIAQDGYPGLKDYAYSFGFGGMTAKWRIVSGFEVRGVFWRPGESDVSETELYGANLVYNIGFNVLKPHAKARLYPYVGAGMGMYTLRLREHSYSFETALARPVSDVMLTQKTTALQAGVGFDFLVPKKNHPERSRVVGLRAGYVFDTSPARDWTVSDVLVTGGPHFDASGVYAQVIIGKSKVRAFGGNCGETGCMKGKRCGGKCNRSKSQ